MFFDSVVLVSVVLVSVVLVSVVLVSVVVVSVVVVSVVVVSVVVVSVVVVSDRTRGRKLKSVALCGRRISIRNSHWSSAPELSKDHTRKAALDKSYRSTNT